MSQIAKNRIAVVGAGISGLSSAYWLAQHGYQVTIFEASERTGGSIITERKDGYLIDLGPNSALETSETLRQLIRNLGIEHLKIYSNDVANKRYIVRNAKLHALGMSPFKFLTSRLFSTRAKLRLLKEPFIKPVSVEDISLADYVRYRLGNEFLDYAINPFVAGVYAGDPEELSAPAGFPKLFALEQNYGSFIKGAIKGKRERKKRQEVAKDRAKLFSFTTGMQTLTDTLAQKLGDAIHLKAGIDKIESINGSFKLSISMNNELIKKEFDYVILSTPADSLAKIVANIAPDCTTLLNNIKYPPVSVIFMGFEEKQIKRALDGFGFLVPKLENRRILGSIWSSTIFPNRAPKGHVAFTTFVGGTRQPEMTIHDDSSLSEFVLQDLKELIGIEGSPASVRIKTWPRAIPQYSLGYNKVKHLFSELEKQFPGLHIASNVRAGISLGDSILGARSTVEKILNSH